MSSLEITLVQLVGTRGGDCCPSLVRHNASSGFCFAAQKCRRVKHRHGLDQAAIEAAQRVCFNPALQGGRAVDSVVVLHVVF